MNWRYRLEARDYRGIGGGKLRRRTLRVSYSDDLKALRHEASSYNWWEIRTAGIRKLKDKGGAVRLGGARLLAVLEAG